MEQAFKPREVYVASSYMAPVGRYNGREREALSFLQMAEKAGEVFAGSRIRRSDVGAVVVGCQNPVAFSGVDNTAANLFAPMSSADNFLDGTLNGPGAFDDYAPTASGSQPPARRPRR